MSKADEWLVRPQKKLGLVGLIAFLVLASTITPISLDMYIPAIPHMTEVFSTTADIVNLTLVGYFFVYAIGLLIFGPLSDRYGRKAILIAGTICYVLGGAGCALSISIEMLICFRILQAIGAAAMSTISMAVVKDAITAKKRETVLAIMQVMMITGPVLAPVIGAFILQFATWRMTFWVLATVGVICLLLSFFYEETLPKEHRYEGTVFGSIRQLGVVAKNKGFTSFLVICSLFNLPFMAYIAVSSYIYQSFFGLSELEYSYFFAIAALITILGPFIWLQASKYISARRFTTIIIGICLIAGIFMLVIGQRSPFTFFATFIVYALATACIRPYSSNILLSQQNEDTGAASSLINFTHTGVGCIGMVVAVLPWPNFVLAIASLIVGMAIMVSISWFAFLRSSMPLKGLKDVDPRKPANSNQPIDVIEVSQNQG